MDQKLESSSGEFKFLCQISKRKLQFVCVSIKNNAVSLFGTWRHWLIFCSCPPRWSLGPRISRGQRSFGWMPWKNVCYSIFSFVIYLFIIFSTAWRNYYGSYRLYWCCWEWQHRKLICCIKENHLCVAASWAVARTETQTPLSNKSVLIKIPSLGPRVRWLVEWYSSSRRSFLRAAQTLDL